MLASLADTPSHPAKRRSVSGRDEPLRAAWVALGLALLLAGCAETPTSSLVDGSGLAADAARVDAARADAGLPDAGLPDAGLTDAGLADAAPPDAGLTDAAVVVADAGSPAVVRGTVQYEDRPFDEHGFTGELAPRPARQVTVSLLDATGAVLATGTTDDDGRFELAPAAPIVTAVTVRARAEVAFAGHRARVIDRRGRGSVYTVESPPFDVSAAADVTLLARADTGIGGAFNIVDVLYSAFLVYAPHVGTPAPTLTVQWQAGLSFACSSCYAGDVISLGGQLADTDEYDDGIILHEAGHYFVDHYSRDTSPGGAHRDRLVDPELAYGEGVGYFFACMVLGSPLIVDTYLGSNRIMQFEAVTLDGVSRTDFVGTSTGRIDGQLREEIVAGILWDAFDAASAAEPFDRVALGVAGQLAILVDYFGTWPHADQGAPGIDVADFLHALVCEAGVPAADAEALAANRGLPWTAGPCLP